MAGETYAVNGIAEPTKAKRLKMDSDYDRAQASKTPASWIEEICRKQNNTPTWDIYDCKAEVGSPLPKFKCILQLTYNDAKLKAEAIENSRKAAKQSAAKRMLDAEMKLTPKDYYEINGSNKTTNGEPASPQASKIASAPKTFLANSDIDAGMGPNPIGELKDFCAKYSLGPPEYADKDSEGPSHLPTFEIECFLCNQAKSEKGGTKKLAKKRVAHKWLMHLKSLKMEEILALGGDISDSSLRLPCPWSFEQCANVISHKNHLFQKWCGELINFLKSEEYNENELILRGGPQPFLDALGKECNFVPEYRFVERGVEENDGAADSDEETESFGSEESSEDILEAVEELEGDNENQVEERNQDGMKETGIPVKNENIRYLLVLAIRVGLSKVPEAVFISVGETEEAVKTDAALQAIEHIQDLATN